MYKPLSHQLILPESKLIDVKKHWRLFRDWIDKRYFQLQLLYRGSEHGFKKLPFNQRCDNQGPTVTVVQSEYDLLFGGYTNIGWTSHENQYLED